MAGYIQVLYHVTSGYGALPLIIPPFLLLRRSPYTSNKYASLYWASLFQASLVLSPRSKV
ncbi:hypothetical protein F4781DRAFT_438088 [Annulohypoxylon bovei var. microspora]|nr:hypothetical protein F4781DRAFT_438088 [Annulohypoxylon bovei var. microspora]